VHAPYPIRSPRRLTCNLVALSLAANWFLAAICPLASAQSEFPIPPSPFRDAAVAQNEQLPPSAKPPVVADDVEPIPAPETTPELDEDSVLPQRQPATPPRTGPATPQAVPPVPPATPLEVPLEGPLDDFTDTAPLTDFAAADVPAAEPPGLAGIPDMFGDTFFGTPALFYSGDASVGPAVGEAIVDLPIAGGSYRTKISENNKAVPVSRIYFLYDHFRNAFNSTVEGRTAMGDRRVASIDDSLDRYVLGWEQALFGGTTSVEIRMPFAGVHTFDFAPPPFEPAGTLQVRGGQVGNLTVILKELLYADSYSAFSWGIGIEAPTGSDAMAVVDSQRFRIGNDAVHISPFIALLHQPTPCLFFNGFAQLDIPTSGNRVQVRDLGTQNIRRLGQWNDQILLHLDASAGWWVYQNPCAPFIKGLAPLLELHYATSRLQAADVVTDGSGSDISHSSSPASFFVSSRTDQLDLFTITIALHAELACRTKLRVGGILPIVNRDDRLFDGEFGLQINHYF